jgi:hypothetical protein
MSAGTLLLSLSVQTVVGGNPAGSGQPGAECGEEGATSEPAGFLKPGFEVAESHYAGSDGTASLANANSDHAVSQYDVACYQVTLHH